MRPCSIEELQSLKIYLSNLTDRKLLNSSEEKQIVIMIGTEIYSLIKIMQKNSW